MTELREKIDQIRSKLNMTVSKQYKFMEVCGTHTMSIAANGIRSLLPEKIKLISGPGCPVCVTSQGDIEGALVLARKKEVIITTFGDMIRVPSRKDKLENYKNVRIIYSPLDSLTLAEENPDREIVFLGIGFETTAPLIAETIKEARFRKLNNFSVLSFHKTVPAALKMILSDPDCEIDGLILPGHVSAVTGSDYFNFLSPFRKAAVVAGFDALDLMECIYILAEMTNRQKPEIINNYSAVVSREGNKAAISVMNEVFEPIDADWRGIGMIESSGLGIRKEFEAHDAKKKFSLEPEMIPEPEGCLCGAILLGKATPIECVHFGKSCTPLLPVGPCMVSSEGSCAAWYKYGTGER